jgi:hypothetical protein
MNWIIVQYFLCSYCFYTTASREEIRLKMLCLRKGNLLVNQNHLNVSVWFSFLNLEFEQHRMKGK